MLKLRDVMNQDRLTATQPVNKFLAFHETQNSFRCLAKPEICPSPGPDECTQHVHSTFLAHPF